MSPKCSPARRDPVPSVGGRSWRDDEWRRVRRGPVHVDGPRLTSQSFASDDERLVVARHGEPERLHCEPTRHAGAAELSPTKNEIAAVSYRNTHRPVTECDPGEVGRERVDRGPRSHRTGILIVDHRKMKRSLQQVRDLSLLAVETDTRLACTSLGIAVGNSEAREDRIGRTGGTGAAAESFSLRSAR